MTKKKSLQESIESEQISRTIELQQRIKELADHLLQDGLMNAESWLELDMTTKALVLESVYALDCH